MTFTYASRDDGCWVRVGLTEPRRCRVRTEPDIRRGILVQSHTRPGQVSPPVRELVPGTVREMYSAGVKLAVVARGEADVYVNTYNNFSDWDICAGHILVTEAGGIVSGLRGEAISYGNTGFRQTHGLVAASAAAHPSAIAGLANMSWA
jgi:3'(2'), 5'-bisphosphate nucleotidase